MRAMARRAPAAALRAAKKLMQVNGIADRARHAGGAARGFVGFATDNPGHRAAIRGFSHRNSRNGRAEPLCPALFTAAGRLRAAAWALQNPRCPLHPAAIRRQTGAALQLSVD